MSGINNKFNIKKLFFNVLRYYFYLLIKLLINKMLIKFFMNYKFLPPLFINIIRVTQITTLRNCFIT
jgi:hypothetical protein